MRLKSSSGHKSSDISSKAEQMSLKMICFKGNTAQRASGGFVRNLLADFQPIFSGITSAHKFILRDCRFPFEHLHGCLVGKIGKHFFFKLPLSIKNSSENGPYFWNCFVFTLLKNCAMLFAGGENRCL